MNQREWHPITLNFPGHKSIWRMGGTSQFAKDWSHSILNDEAGMVGSRKSKTKVKLIKQTTNHLIWSATSLPAYGIEESKDEFSQRFTFETRFFRDGANLSWCWFVRSLVVALHFENNVCKWKCFPINGTWDDLSRQGKIDWNLLQLFPT